MLLGHASPPWIAKKPSRLKRPHKRRRETDYCLTSQAGDALLHHPADGSIHFLDVISDKVEHVADNDTAFQGTLDSAENVDRWLMHQIVDGQAALGMRPGANECFVGEPPWLWTRGAEWNGNQKRILGFGSVP
jgi:hypothetical protein